MKKKGAAEILTFLSDVGFGVCLGILVDQLVGTSFTFTIIGTGLGIVLAIVLEKARKKGE